MNRAVDALSTIMWPSMIQLPSVRSRRGIDAEMSELTLDESIDDLGSGMEGISDLDGYGRSGLVRMQRDLEQLQNWLDEDETSKKQNDLEAWTTNLPNISISSAPDFSTGHAFDDDFTDFVTAIPSGLSASQGRVSYHSLPSVSDLGEPVSNDYIQIETDNDNDDLPHTELPSAEEIHATAARIYGQGDGIRQTNSVDQEELDFDSPAFDLSRVFGALQVMKEEIGNITDEKEKRQAAARAALGLVYGLDIGNEDAEHELDS